MTAVMPEREPYRLTAMQFLADGQTAESVRADAADPHITGHVARIAGITPDEAREQMLAVARAIEAIEARGWTAEKCRLLLSASPYGGGVMRTKQAAAEQVLAMLDDEEFDGYCASVDESAWFFRQEGIVREQAIAAGESAVAEVIRRRDARRGQQ